MSGFGNDGLTAIQIVAHSVADCVALVSLDRVPLTFGTERFKPDAVV